MKWDETMVMNWKFYGENRRRNIGAFMPNNGDFCRD
jgi:hypothetical protein